jgi:hypothetical protein
MNTSISKENILNFLLNLYVHDYYQQGDVLVGFTILDFKKNSNIIDLKYEFHSIRDENEQLGKLFEIRNSIIDEYFPASVYKMTLTERYIWDTSEQCDGLDEYSFRYESTDIDAISIAWGNPKMPRDMIDKVIEKLDPLEIAATLIHKYGATEKHLPEFIPLAIRKKIHQCVIDYLNIN